MPTYTSLNIHDKNPRIQLMTSEEQKNMSARIISKDKLYNIYYNNLTADRHNERNGQISTVYNIIYLLINNDPDNKLHKYPQRHS